MGDEPTLDYSQTIVGLSHTGGAFGVQAGINYGFFKSDDGISVYGGFSYGFGAGVNLKPVALDVIVPSRGLTASYVLNNASYVVSTQLGAQAGLVYDKNNKVIGVLTGAALSAGAGINWGPNKVIELKVPLPNFPVILKQLDRFGIDLNGLECFPPSTPILAPCGHTPISHIQTGDIILAFAPLANFGRGALVEKRVTKLFRNTTTEWIELDLGKIDPATGESFKLTCTLGHHFLDEFGNFPTIAELLLRGGGKAKIVLEDGALLEVTGKRIVWSEETAHLYGGLAARRSVARKSSRLNRRPHTGRVRAAVLSANAASLWRASACVLTMPATMASA